MPTFPGFTATTSPPRSSGAVRATDIGALTRTSEQAELRGIGAFGEVLRQGAGLAFQAAQNRQAIDDAIEWGTATSRVKDRFRLAEDAAERMDVSLDMPLPDDPDYLKTLQSFSTDARDKFLTEALKGIEGDVNKINTGFKSEKNKVQFNNWYNDNYGNMANRVRSMYDKKLDSYQRSEMDKLRETAAANGDVETANKFTALMDKYELITPERAEALKKNNKVIADTSITTRLAEDIMAVKGYQEAIEFVMSQDIDVVVRDRVLSDLATQERIRSARHDQLRDENNRQMLADYWDGKLSDPQMVTDAFRAGYLDETDAKYLRDAIMNPDPPKTTNEALIAVRYAIDGIAEGTETRQSALKMVISYTDKLSPTDGKAFIKEIFGEHDTQNAFWNRQAQEYMEKQIMEVATLTGILYGSGEQLALSAQALMAYDSAKKSAAASKKPLKGKELLELAHEVMLPFREQVKPLLEGEELPKTLGGRIVGEGRIGPGKKAVAAIEIIAGQVELERALKPLKKVGPKAVKSLGDVPEPKDKREFINKLRELEGIDPALSAEYYKKYLDKFW